MNNSKLKDYNLEEINPRTAKTLNGGDGFFYWLGCQYAKIVNAYGESLNPLNSPITGPTGNKYM